MFVWPLTSTFANSYSCYVDCTHKRKLFSGGSTQNQDSSSEAGLTPLQSAACFAELFFKSLGLFERNSNYSNLKQKRRDLSSARVNLQYHATPRYRRVSLSYNISSVWSALAHGIYVSAEDEPSGLWERADPVRYPVSSPALPQISRVIWVTHLSGLLLAIWGWSPCPAASRLANPTCFCMANLKSRAGKGG